MKLIAGVDLGGTKCLGVLAGADHVVRAESQLSVARSGSAEEALEVTLEDLRSIAAAQGAEIAALGVGIPAVVDPRTGLAVRGPNAGWDGFDLDAVLRRLGVPFGVENDVNLAALAEGDVGQAVGVETYAVIAIGTGLGGAVVNQRRCLPGANNAAGELGILPVAPFADPAGRSNLEQILSGKAIADNAAAYLAEHPAARRELGSDPDAKAVFAAALDGSPAGQALLAPVLRALAYAVTALSAVIDPGLVVLDGSVGRALAPFLDKIQFPPGLPAPRLAVSRLEPSATALGALRLASTLPRPTTVKEIADVGHY
ncbi:MAG: ROK family protein [Propionibacteriaceae bacterium]|jgi:glucokinase|nr:ROK family protein [Propionibacteriaceae bacterium]